MKKMNYFLVTLADGRKFWIVAKARAESLKKRNPGATISGPIAFSGALPACLA